MKNFLKQCMLFENAMNELGLLESTTNKEAILVEYGYYKLIESASDAVNSILDKIKKLYVKIFGLLTNVAKKILEKSWVLLKTVLNYAALAGGLALAAIAGKALLFAAFNVKTLKEFHDKMEKNPNIITKIAYKLSKGVDSFVNFVYSKLGKKQELVKNVESAKKELKQSIDKMVFVKPADNKKNKELKQPIDKTKAVKYVDESKNKEENIATNFSLSPKK